MKVKKVIDAQDFACSLPLVHANLAMQQFEKGDILEIHVNQSKAKQDLINWSEATHKTIVKEKTEDDICKMWIKK